MKDISIEQMMSTIFADMAKSVTEEELLKRPKTPKGTYKYIGKCYMFI